MRFRRPFTFLVLSLVAHSWASQGGATPVSHYTFEEPGQLGKDSGTFARNGVAAGNARHSTESRVGGGALFLDGNGDYLTVGGASDYSSLDDNGDGFTVAAWIRPESLSGVRRIFSTGMASGFVSSGWGVGSSGTLPFATTYGRADFNSEVESLSAGVWTHVAYVYRPAAGQIRFYVDGSLVATVAGNPGMNNTANGFIIGGIALSGGGQWFHGHLDDLRIYDNELDAAAIAALAASGSGPEIAYFHAHPAPLAEPGASVLRWAATDAEAVTLDGGPFSGLDVTGQTTIGTGILAATTTFTLTAEAGGASSSRQAVVAVTGAVLDPAITEFLALNESVLADEDGDFSDWIELHNPNAFDFSLLGWHLTDDAAEPDKWQFPDVSIPGGGFLLVFASDKNRREPGGEAHGNFKLSAGGEYLALTRPDASVAQAFAPAFPLQLADYSYGPSGGSGAYFVPTPGTTNGTPLVDLPPTIVSVTENPPQPAVGSDLPILAEVLPTGGSIAGVALRYRVGYGSVTEVAMTPLGGGQFQATIPAAAYAAGQMVRWYVTAASTGGSSSRLPAFDDPVESAEYFGTVVADPAITTSLPVLHWFTANAAASETRSGTQASLFFNGSFYDNIYCRTRGQSAGSWPKHKFKFDFYRGEHFRWDPSQPKVEEFNLQSFYREVFGQSSNSSYMREPLMLWWLAEAGVAAPHAFHLHLRRNGTFYGLFAFIEQVDEEFLVRHGYSATGPLYKAAWQSGGPATLAPNPVPGQYRKSLREDEPFSDLAAFCAGINASNPNRFAYVWDTVDVAQWINLMAAMNVPFNHDQLTKNYYVYFEPTTGDWHRFPWDADQSFPVGQYITGENWTNPRYGDPQHTQELNGGVPNPAWQNHMHAAIMANPVTRGMYMRRVKSLADRYLAANASSSTLVAEDAGARYRVPTDSSLNATWFGSGFDDSGWEFGAQGFGYENLPGDYDGLIATTVKPQLAAPGANTIYLRYRFQLGEAQLAEFQALTLRVKYDDAFIAYLNGTEISRANITGTPTWNTTTAGRGSDSLNDQYAEFPVTGGLGSLVVGENVLAIHAINDSPSNSDMLLVAELVGGSLPYFENLVETTRAAIKADADADRAAWAAKGVSISAIESGIGEILNTALPARRTHLFQTYAFDGPNPQLPEAQPASPAIAFGAIDYNPASGIQDEEFIEILNLETVAIDISDWTVDGGVRHRFKPGTVLPANGSLLLSPNLLAFRGRTTSPKPGESRFVQGNYSGHLSNLGETLVLSDEYGAVLATTETPFDPTDAQRYLVVSEIMYHPVNADDEFIELLNTSDSVTLDLTGVAFTAGIRYAFPPGTQLAPGARVVVSFADFQDGSRLSNGGDRLKLEDATGSTVREFSYDDGFPWPTSPDGGGPSLVLIAPESVPDHGDPSNWRPSATFGGNPGSDDRVPFHGGDPIGYALADLPSVGLGASGLPEFRYAIRLGADAVEAEILASNDLTTWVPAAVTPVSSVHDGLGVLTRTFAVMAEPGETGIFLRLRLTER